MALSAFDDKDEPPDGAGLRVMLGTAAPLWTRVVAEVSAAHGPVDTPWNFGGVKFGWSMRVRKGERVVLYMTPCAGHFLVGVVLGEAAVATAKAAGLPSDVEAALDASPKYAEGRGFRFAVRTELHVAAIVTLAAAKLAAPPKRAGKTRKPRGTGAG